MAPSILPSRQVHLALAHPLGILGSLSPPAPGSVILRSRKKASPAGDRRAQLSKWLRRAHIQAVWRVHRMLKTLLARLRRSYYSALATPQAHRRPVTVTASSAAQPPRVPERHSSA